MYLYLYIYDNLYRACFQDKNKNAKNSTETSDNVESSDQQHTTTVVSKDEDSHRENSIQGSVNDLAECDMTASMLATKQKISTEEEAKAALAERRKLAREQAERDAELERQRLVCPTNVITCT